MSRLRFLPIALLAAACHAGHSPPVASEFLVAAGDSTFWVRSGPQGVHVNGVPLHLAYFGGRFYETYVVDDDRSYTRAVIVGQSLYRRDLITNDSMLVFHDTAMANLEQWYVRHHPHDRPLGDDEDPDEDLNVDASSDLDVLGTYGPYLSYSYDAGADLADRDGWRASRRGVLDLRSGRPVSLAQLFGVEQATSIVQRGAELLARLEDSVRASRDARARIARHTLGAFRFDSMSFVLVDVDRGPAVEFVVPGRGWRAGGLSMALPPIPVAPPAWWTDIARTLPATPHDSSLTQWQHAGYRVLARYDSANDATGLSLVDSAGRRWAIGTVPSPAHRVFWLDAPAVDSTTRHALERAFRDAALYSDDARIAMTKRSSPAVTPVSRPGRPVRESQHETSEIMMPQHANNMGHVFGGVILSLLDRTAAVSAIRHARQQCVTVSVDRVDFREPIHLGDLIIMKSSVNFAGRTSMEVGVRVEAENLLDGVRRHTNSCYVTFVAIDRNGRPVEVPAVIPETEDEQRRYLAAQERRRRRLEEREAEGR
ncbi:MAG TPA: acyl-CoA thioesterase [Gemmatimonadaceae bacterium]|nr:acyl-CoA thioesterase [Gemmatimonadaceae bacterium]